MIADWTVDAGAGSPSIDVPWEGWVDLHWGLGDVPWNAEAAGGLPEVRAYPELLTVLMLANRLHTSTSKLDVFAVSSEEVDPEIAEAGEAASRCGLGSYLDLVTHRLDVFDSFERFEALARRAAVDLRKMEIPGGCAEIVVRPAHLYGESSYGWSLYAMGFGPDEGAARTCWEQSSRVVAAVTLMAVAGLISDHGFERWAGLSVLGKAWSG